MDAHPSDRPARWRRGKFEPKRTYYRTLKEALEAIGIVDVGRHTAVAGWARWEAARPRWRYPYPNDRRSWDELLAAPVYWVRQDGTDPELHVTREHLNPSWGTTNVQEVAKIERDGVLMRDVPVPGAPGWYCAQWRHYPDWIPTGSPVSSWRGNPRHDDVGDANRDPLPPQPSYESVMGILRVGDPVGSVIQPIAQTPRTPLLNPQTCSRCNLTVPKGRVCDTCL